MPLGAPRNCIMALVDHSNDAVHFIVTAHVPCSGPCHTFNKACAAFHSHVY